MVVRTNKKQITLSGATRERKERQARGGGSVSKGQSPSALRERDLREREARQESRAVGGMSLAQPSDFPEGGQTFAAINDLRGGFTRAPREDLEQQSFASYDDLPLRSVGRVQRSAEALEVGREEQGTISLVQPVQVVDKPPSLLREDSSAFERRRIALESERLNLQERGSLTTGQALKFQALETGLRGAAIIEKGAVFSESFAKSLFSGKGSPFRQKGVKAAFEDLRGTTIPTGSELISNPLLAIPSAAAFAFETGATGTAITKTPPRTTASITDSSGIIRITAKGDQASFLSEEAFKATITQSPSPTGFRTTFFKPEKVGSLEGVITTRGGVTGIGRVSDITSESFLTVRQGESFLVKDSLLQQSSGFASTTKFAQRTKLFDVNTGLPKSSQTEFGGKLVVQESGLLKVGSTSVQASGRGFGFSEGAFREQFATTVKGVRTSFGTTGRTASDIGQAPVLSLGKRGSLGNARISSFRSDLSEETLAGRITPPRTFNAAQNALKDFFPSPSTSRGFIIPKSTTKTAPALVSRTSRSSVYSPSLESTTSSLGGRVVPSPLATKIVSKNDTASRIKPSLRVSTSQSPVSRTQLLSSNALGVITPSFSGSSFSPRTKPSRALPFLKLDLPPSKLISPTRKKKRKSEVRGYSFTPSLIGLEYNVGKIGGTLFSGVGRRRRKK